MVAMDAMDKIAWLLSFHLQALAETENDKRYVYINIIPDNGDITLENK